jgi:hypothetical protein
VKRDVVNGWEAAKQGAITLVFLAIGVALASNAFSAGYVPSIHVFPALLCLGLAVVPGKRLLRALRSAGR